MTGYGMADYEDDKWRIHVEVKTLNSKFLDLVLKLPKQFSDKELEVRNLISDRLVRGKVSLTIEVNEKKFGQLPVAINKELFHAYVKEYITLAKEADLPVTDIFKLILQSPNVISNQTESVEGQADWHIVRKVVEQALDRCSEFREAEGASLYAKLQGNVQVLNDGLADIRVHEPNRKSRIRERIRGHFSDWLEENNFDQNRFEQELIYYFEKLDITEEIVRLETHLNYFELVLQSEQDQGKKLGFISQEIGREINTIGSKANDVVIQKIVIQMKDELEKIKEQMLNIL
ncbi:Protein YicC [Lunatimonas lonarensis]|uniref:Protein YicC n=2 Tax=Lunatimonas lonarensis TaxID=1232681 RepID=R7ZX72_9BACT|nr:Protein YicC [Lunatimonas lonarensis]